MAKITFAFYRLQASTILSLYNSKTSNVAIVGLQAVSMHVLLDVAAGAWGDSSDEGAGLCCGPRTTHICQHWQKSRRLTYTVHTECSNFSRCKYSINRFSWTNQHDGDIHGSAWLPMIASMHIRLVDLVIGISRSPSFIWLSHIDVTFSIWHVFLQIFRYETISKKIHVDSK